MFKVCNDASPPPPPHTHLPPLPRPQLGTADAEINDHLLRTQSFKVLPLKPGVGQNIAKHASPTARDFFLELLFAFPVHSPSFFLTPLPSFCRSTEEKKSTAHHFYPPPPFFFSFSKLTKDRQNGSRIPKTVKTFTVLAWAGCPLLDVVHPVCPLLTTASCGPTRKLIPLRIQSLALCSTWILNSESASRVRVSQP